MDFPFRNEQASSSSMNAQDSHTCVISRIIQFHQKLGNKWTQIQKFFQSNSGVKVKNIFNSFLRQVVREVKQLHFDPILLSNPQYCRNLQYVLCLIKRDLIALHSNTGRKGGYRVKDNQMKKLLKKAKLSYLDFQKYQYNLNQFFSNSLQSEDGSTNLEERGSPNGFIHYSLQLPSIQYYLEQSKTERPPPLCIYNRWNISEQSLMIPIRILYSYIILP